MICFESQSHADKEAFFWDDGIDGILACERTVHGIHVEEPVNVSALGTLFENRIDDVGIDVTLAIRHGKINQVSSVFGYCNIGLKILDHAHIVLQVDKLRMQFPKFPGAQKNKHHEEE